MYLNNLGELLRNRGDPLLPATCSKSTALELVEHALEKHSYESGSQIAQECLARQYLLNRTEKMLICIAIIAGSTGRLSQHEQRGGLPIDELWREATAHLPPSQRHEAASFMIRLMYIFLEKGEITRAWNALYEAEGFVTTGASRLHYNDARQAYEEAARRHGSSSGNIIDLKL